MRRIIVYGYVSYDNARGAVFPILQHPLYVCVRKSKDATNVGIVLRRLAI